MNISGNKFQPSGKISNLVKHGLKEMDALWTPDVEAPEAAIAKGEEYLAAISRQSDSDEIKKFAGYARKLAHSTASGLELIHNDGLEAYDIIELSFKALSAGIESPVKALADVASSVMSSTNGEDRNKRFIGKEALKIIEKVTLNETEKTLAHTSEKAASKIPDSGFDSIFSTLDYDAYVLQKTALDTIAAGVSGPVSKVLEDVKDRSLENMRDREHGKYIENTFDSSIQKYK